MIQALAVHRSLMRQISIAVAELSIVDFEGQLYLVDFTVIINF